MRNEGKNVCKKHKLKIEKSEKKLDFLEENILNNNRNNVNERKEVCSKHPQRNTTITNLGQSEYDFHQRGLCRLFETNINEVKIESPSKSVELINDSGKLKLKEKIILPEEKPYTDKAVDKSTSKKEKKDTNGYVSRVSTIKSYDKNELIWKFLYKFFEDNPEKLFLLKDKYKTDGGFFTYLSELSIAKLSNETRLLKNLHRNTIKALPKVIIAIFLLYSQKIESLTGNDLEKKSGMVGQYKKLRAIADHLGLELPFIIGDVVEKILEEKLEDIFKEKFFPSPENVCRLDKRLKPSRKVVKIISRWIQKNSDYKNLTDLKDRLFEKKPSKPKDDDTRLVLFDKDKDKNRMLFRNICDTIIEENPKINSYNNITKIIGTSVTTLMKNDNHRRYIKYTNFLKLRELINDHIPHQIFIRPFRSDKWIFLWQDSDGNKLSDNQAKKRAGEYLIKEILKGDTTRYDMDYIKDVLKRDDFISYLKERKLKYNEILGAGGLELNADPNRWEIFNWSSDGNPRTYEDALVNASKHLKKLMEDYNYEEDKIPSQEYIVRHHEDFHGALKRYNFNFYDVLKKAGFPGDKFRKKWWIFENDEQGTILTPQEQEEVIFKLFKEKILPIYMDKGLIEGNLGPSYDEAVDVLKDTKFHGFVSAINARGVSHGSLLLSVGLSPRITPNQQAGIAFHWIAEYNFMIHTRIDNNCISFYESKINEENFVRPDNTILVNKDFLELSKYTMLIPSQIKYIHIDYYLFHSSKRSQYKFGRGYQSNDSILLLVPLNIKKSKTTQLKNIKILSVYDFCDFFGFSDERRRELIQFARLALGSVRDTIDSIEKLSKLEEKADQYKNELKTNPKINFSI